MEKRKVYSSYVNGSWLLDGDRVDMEIENPGNLDETAARCQFCSEQDVQDAVEAASGAAEMWADTPVPVRGDYVLAFLEKWGKRVEEVSRIASLEMGKPYQESIMEEKRTRDEMDFWVGEIHRLGGKSLPSRRPNTEITTIRQPIGPVVAITPWNFPILSPLRKVIPALICGCPVILKPSIQCPGPAVVITEIFDEIDLPPGVFNLIIGSGRNIGSLLTTHKDVAGITFTGSTEVGMKINEAAARNNVKVQLEMGGKNASVIADYHDIDNAAKQIVGAAFTTCGQRCTSVSRVIVLEQQKAELEEAIKRHTEAIKVGYGLDAGTQMGPVSSKEQYDNVRSYLAKVDQGEGRILAQGSIPGDKKGYYIPATVVTDVKPGSTLAMEEIFGPVLVIITAKDFEEALQINNETIYGLTSSIFTDDINYAYRFSMKSRTGMVHVNHGTASEGHVPFGGVKMSGHGAFGIGDTFKEFFTDMKSVYRVYS